MRESLLLHLLQLIREFGPDNFSLRQLAQRVGVSQTAIYRHFADKNALFAELASQSLLELMAIVTQAMQPAENAKDKVRLAARAYLAYAIQEPEKYRLMFGPTIQDRDNHPVLVEAGEQALALLLAFVDEGQKQGEFVAGPSELMASSCWASLHGYALFLLDGLYERLSLDENLEQAIEHHIDMLLKSLSYPQQR